MDVAVINGMDGFYREVNGIGHSAQCSVIYIETHCNR